MVINEQINDLCMQPPDELMVDAFLPAMRQLVALNLRSDGLSQSKISSLLGITQASVSMYLSSDAGRAYRSLAKLSVPRSDADAYARELTESVLAGATAGVRKLNAVWTGILGSGAACGAHRERYPSLSTCDMCVQEYGRASATSATVSEVAEAVRLIEGSPRFAAAMPEVYVNIACALADAKDPSGVVALPGRIVKVRGRAKALLPPEPGASAHMAKMLLLVRSARPDLKACVNLRFDRNMGRVLSDLGVKTVRVSGAEEQGADDPTVAALEKKLSTSRDKFDAVVEEGGGGIEPNVYLFGAGALAVAGTAIRVAGAYSAREEL